MVPLLAATTMLLTACKTSETYPPNSIAGNRSIPVRELSYCFDSEGWDKIRTAPYDGYVVLRGKIVDSELKVTGIVESYPDNSRDRLALEFAKELYAREFSLGSRIPTQATVHALFYETGQEPNVAIVYTDRNEGMNLRDSNGGSITLRIWSY